MADGNDFVISLVFFVHHAYLLFHAHLPMHIRVRRNPTVARCYDGAYHHFHVHDELIRDI